MEPSPLAKFFAMRHSAGSEESGESDGSGERPAQVRRLSPLVREPNRALVITSRGASSLAAFFIKRSAVGTSGASSSSYERPLHRPGGRGNGPGSCSQR
eukprot:1005950-Prymnesium_polylepis.1